MMKILFTSGEPLAVNVHIPLTPIGMVDFSNKLHALSLELKVFYNGEDILRNTFTEVRHPSEFHSDFELLTNERAVSVTLLLPRPIPDDAGVYELQMFLEPDDSLEFPPNCSDYEDFLDFLKLPRILVGSATLMVQPYGRL